MLQRLSLLVNSRRRRRRLLLLLLLLLLVMLLLLLLLLLAETLFLLLQLPLALESGRHEEAALRHGHVHQRAEVILRVRRQPLVRVAGRRQAAGRTRPTGRTLDDSGALLTRRRRLRRLLLGWRCLRLAAGRGRSGARRGRRVSRRLSAVHSQLVARVAAAVR